jgi:geranylgeranyl diphosphate synthase type I
MPTVPQARRPQQRSVPSFDRNQIRSGVDATLTRFLDEQVRESPACIASVVDVIGDFLSGGKRLRPVFCYWGWIAAGGDPDSSVILRIGAALELFHAFALIHDDIIDASQLRRGRPTVHRIFADQYSHQREPGETERFGTNAAILLGDLCLTWSDALMNAPDVEESLDSARLAAIRLLIDRMRTEVLAGQCLDVEVCTEDDELTRAFHVLRYKTASYTTERPLQIGAAAAGGDQSFLDALAGYARPLGEAFQLRDDLLGVSGDQRLTGKPVIDDLREGKQTVLMVLAWRRANDRQRAIISALHGSPDLDENGAERLREVIRDTGAPRRVESMIEERTEQAIRALGQIPMAGRAHRALLDLAHTATNRRS